MKIRIADIINFRYEDGPGIRTTIFFQGCDIGCFNCQNKEIWNINGGKEYTVDELFEKIVSFRLPYKKITISGGEPMMQCEGLIQLIEKFYENNFEIGLYTSFEIENIPEKILKKIKYLKTGKYIENMKVENKFYGSQNQKFFKLLKGKVIGEI